MTMKEQMVIIDNKIEEANKLINTFCNHHFFDDKLKIHAEKLSREADKLINQLKTKSNRNKYLQSHSEFHRVWDKIMSAKIKLN
jgi:hypothetical protein